MNRFFQAIEFYYSIVDNAVNKLTKHLNANSDYEIKCTQELLEFLSTNNLQSIQVENQVYYRHGNGMVVVENGIEMIDWDFGVKDWLCGIDPFFMATTLKASQFQFIEFYDAIYIKEQCEYYLNNKIFYKVSNQYYLNLLAFGIKKQVFPENYDQFGVFKNNTLIILLNRSKGTDKFLRKSKEVFNRIDDLEDNYVIVLYANEIELVRFSYNSLAYHDDAIKIMESFIKPYK